MEEVILIAHRTLSDRIRQILRKARIPLYICGVIAVFIAINLFTRSSILSIGSADELRGFDFENHIARIDPRIFDWYPGALYTPEDFAAGVAGEPSDFKEEKTYRFYTYRLVFELEQGEVYGISAFSGTYAHTLWVDGKILSSVGIPGDSEETTVAKINHIAVYFTAQEGQTEIVIQRADFTSATYGRLYPQFLGKQSLISNQNEGLILRNAIVIGSMLTAALIFFSMFLFVEKRSSLLWFSLACAMTTIRSLVLDYYLITMLFPDITANQVISLEFTVTFLGIVFIVKYINLVFRRVIPAAISILIYSACIIFVLIVLLTPPMIFTQYLTAMLICLLSFGLTAIVFLLLGMVDNRGSRRIDHVLIMLGISIFITFVVIDALRPRYYGGFVIEYNLAQMGMLTFIFMNALAQALNMTRTEALLRKAQMKEREMEDTTLMLMRHNSLKNEFFQNMSHDFKTPLTAISVCVLDATSMLDFEHTPDELRVSLNTAQREIMRMARMVEGAIKHSQMFDNEHDIVPMDIETLLFEGTETYRALLERNGNTLTVDIPTPLPLIYGNADLLLHVMSNLLSNANRYTRNGDIVISAQSTVSDGEPVVLIKVSDTGEGVKPELLPIIFQRGVSDRGTGLGLYICKTALADHDGKIWVESEQGKGTKVSFTIPMIERREKKGTLAEGEERRKERGENNDG